MKTIDELNSLRHPECRWTFLTIVSPDKVLSKCICGKLSNVAIQDILRGRSSSCGCVHYRKVSEKKKITIEEINKRKPTDSLLTALAFTEPTISPCGKTLRKAWFICKCGNVKEIGISQVCRGKIKSCNGKKHHLTKEEVSLKIIYKSMIARCYNPKCSAYKFYGEKGVRVCDEWLNSFNAYANWALNNGWKRGLEIDKDIKGDGLLYGPDTCSVVTQHINGTVKKKNPTRSIIYNGETISLMDACRRENAPYHSVNRNIRKGYSFEEAINLIKNK